ncbi:hypothetical protein HKCCE2091_18605 [Rhodobacterales bacterium HKCCE2091]|nr:hypothetical protein [Rhodobacterales bacterium HKCCE2091]
MTDSDAATVPQEAEATPRKPPRRRGRKRRILLRVVEVAGLLILAPVLFGLIAIWAATDNRIRLPEAVETRIATRLDAAMEANDVSVDEIGIALPEGRFTPEIVLSGVSLRDGDGLRAYFPEVSVLLDGGALLTGQIRPKRVRLDGAGMRLSRDVDGVIDVALSASGAAAERGITETLARIDAMFAEPAFSELEEVSGQGLVLLMADAVTGQIIQSQDAALRLERKGAALTLLISGSVDATRAASIEIAVTRNPALGRNDMLFAFENLAARDLATASPALAWLDLMRAPIDGRLVGQVSDSGVVGDVQGSLTIGAGQIQPGSGADAIAVERIAAEIDFDADTGMLRFDALDLATDPLSFTATGQAEIDEDGGTMTGQFRFAGLNADPEGLFGEPLAFDGGALDLRLRLRPTLDLTIGQAVLYDGPMRVQVWGGASVGDEGLTTRLDARIPEMTARDILPYWPETAIPGTRDWIARNLLDGEISGFAASVRTGPDGAAHAIRFDFDGLELAALPGMPPIEDGSGWLSVIGDALTLRLSRAEVAAPTGGTLDLSGSTMSIPTLATRNPDAHFELSVSGPVEAAGSLLSLPPVNLLADSELDPAALASGHAEVDVGLDLTFRRVIPRDEISFDAAGRLTGLRSDTLVPGRVLTASSLDLEVTPEVVALNGRAELDGVPLTGRWSQVLGTGEGSRAEGRIGITPDALSAFGIGLPPGLVSGAGGADFTLEIPREEPPRLSLASDLSGIGLAPPGLGWRLGTEATGAFEADVVLGAAPDVPRLALTAPGFALEGSVALAEGGGLRSLDFSRLEIGAWADLRGALVGQGAGVAPRVRIDGGTIDLRRLPAQSGGSGGSAIAARLDRLQIADNIALTGLTADLAPGLSGPFRGQVNGGASLSGSLARTQAGLAVRAEAPDAGAVLRSAGLFQNGYGGALDLRLQPTGETGSYLGQLSVDGARLRNAPAMAELLNAISVVGLLEQLGNEGIALGEIDARFRITPRAIYLDEGTAVGPSMGISMDGVYDVASRRYDMQGVVSPFYMINGLVGALFAPRREGLIGVTYRLTGGPEGSNVSVNPLSILTPGIFRDIFRRPPPDAAQTR